MSDIIIPSNPKDRQKLKAGITEIVDVLTMMDGLKEKKKDIVDTLKEEYELKPSVINKMATIMHKRSYSQLQQENEDFETMYESVIEGASLPEDAEDAEEVEEETE